MAENKVRAENYLAPETLWHWRRSSCAPVIVEGVMSCQHRALSGMGRVRAAPPVHRWLTSST